MFILSVSNTKRETRFRYKINNKLCSFFFKNVSYMKTHRNVVINLNVVKMTTAFS